MQQCRVEAVLRTQQTPRDGIIASDRQADLRERETSGSWPSQSASRNCVRPAVTRRSTSAHRVRSSLASRSRRKSRQSMKRHDWIRSASISGRSLRAGYLRRCASMGRDQAVDGGEELRVLTLDAAAQVAGAAIKLPVNWCRRRHVERSAHASASCNSLSVNVAAVILLTLFAMLPTCSCGVQGRPTQASSH